MIDIILGTFRGEKYIEQQIDSILNQSFKDYKIIIRDDLSDDGTKEILKKYQDKYPQTIRVISDNKKNSLGARNNFFELIKYVTSDYVMFCDQDDYWFENKIQSTFDKMKQIEGRLEKNVPILIGSNLVVTDEKLNPLKKQFMKIDNKRFKLNNLLVENQIAGCTMLFNKELIKYVNNIDINKMIMHDWTCILIAKLFGEVDYVEQPLMYYRQHISNVSGATNKHSIKHAYNKIRENKNYNPYISLWLQAEELSNLMKIFKNNSNTEQNNLLNLFVSLKYSGKLHKIFYSIRYNFLKSGILRKIGQLFVV